MKNNVAVGANNMSEVTKTTMIKQAIKKCQMVSRRELVDESSTRLCYL